MALQVHQLTMDQQALQRVKTMASSNGGSPTTEERDEEELSRSALMSFRAKEEEIERRKLEVKEKVQAQLGRVEEESKRLAEIREVSSHCLMILYQPFFCGLLLKLSIYICWNMFLVMEGIGGIDRSIKERTCQREEEDRHCQPRAKAPWIHLPQKG